MRRAGRPALPCQQMLEDGGETFRSKVGSRPGDEPLPVAHALWHCETAFAKAKYVPCALASAQGAAISSTLPGGLRSSPPRASAKPTDYQRIWVFTNDDDPCRSDNAAIKHAVKKAKVRRGRARICRCCCCCSVTLDAAGLHRPRQANGAVAHVAAGQGVRHAPVLGQHRA